MHRLNQKSIHNLKMYLILKIYLIHNSVLII